MSKTDFTLPIERRAPSTDKEAALKDGPVGRVLDKYWNILHDLEYDLEKVLQEYDVAMSYRGGPGAKAARLAYEKIDMTKRAVDKVASGLFDDVLRAEDKFVKQFGEPSEYVAQQRNERFKYGSSTIDEWSAIDFMLNGWEHYYDSTEAETIRDMTRSLDVSPAVAKDLLKAWEAVPVRERSGVMSGQRAAERVLAQVVKKHKLTRMAATKTAKHPLDGVRGHQLLPSGVARKIPSIYSQENEDDPTAWVKLFSPYTNAVWYITEYDPSSKEAFGWADLGMGGGELGYISVRELEGLQKGGLPLVERDLYWKPRKLSQAKRSR